jgi:Flp pilus assembly protein TadG
MSDHPTATSWARSRHGQRGNALAEFAIVSVVFLILTFGVIDFARAMYMYHLVDDGARLGARYAIVHGTSCTAPDCPAQAGDIKSYVLSVSPGVDSNSLSVNPTYPPSTDANTTCAAGGQTKGCLVTVTVTYTYHWMVPILSLFPVPMSSSSTMIISQ